MFYNFSQAVDIVCINCLYCKENRCRRCPVRKTVDQLEKLKKKEAGK